MTDDPDVKQMLAETREELVVIRQRLQAQEVSLKRLKTELIVVWTGLVLWYFFW